MTHNELDDRVVERFVLNLSGLFDEVEQVIDEVVIKHSYLSA